MTPDDQDPIQMHVDDRRLVFRVRCHPQYLNQAARIIGLNPNAVVIDDPEALTTALGSRSATIDYPSFFCTQRSFVLVLAFLARRAQPFEIVLLYSTEPNQEINNYAMIFPALDAHTLEILRQIDPAAATEMDDLNRRIETVLARLKALSFDNDIDGDYPMGDEGEDLLGRRG